ncbi:MAG: aldehyde dehydrogenase [Gammaproteobacteria bacterium]
MNAQAAVDKRFSQYQFSPLADTPANTNQKKLDDILSRVHGAAKSFVSLSIDDRIRLINAMQDGYIKVAERSVEVSCKAKGLDMDSPAAAEEWGGGPLCVIRHLRMIRESLGAIKKTGNTPIGKVGRTSDQRLSVRAFPMSTIDGILFKDVIVDVHTQSGVTEEQLERTRAHFYKQPDHNGRVVLVLGAGNITPIPSMDVITKMFNEGKVCILKMNPVNAYIGPFIEEAFAEVIDRNFLAVVYGGVEESNYLIQSDLVDEIHITGSDKTHHAIVWGPPGPERAERMARNNPVLTKTITSELGCVTPVIVVPGPYKDKELAFQAEDVAGCFTMQASFLCCTPVTLVTAKDWQQRDAFLKHMDKALAAVPARKAYYPGAAERWRTFTEGRANISTFGKAEDGRTPWALIKGLDPDSNETIYTNEPFCSVLTETTLNTSDTIEFLERAVEFVNKKLWGTLTANLIVHPKTMKDPKIAEAVEQAITRLNYGTVTINGWNGMSFYFSTPPWGGHPESTLTDIQSGRGWVHNASMLEGIEKVVLRFPLTSFPKPIWHPSHKTAHKLAQKLIELERYGSWSKVPGVVFTAMRG